MAHAPSRLPAAHNLCVDNFIYDHCSSHSAGPNTQSSNTRTVYILVEIALISIAQDIEAAALTSGKSS